MALPSKRNYLNIPSYYLISPSTCNYRVKCAVHRVQCVVSIQKISTLWIPQAVDHCGPLWTTVDHSRLRRAVLRLS